MIATGTQIVTVPGRVAVLPTVGWFGSRFTGHTVLLGIQLLFPLLRGFSDFFHGFLNSLRHCNVSFADLDYDTTYGTPSS